ncbi:hypothetical protein H6P81_007519 [Aristolochia fimbriata]|uniref:DYW domain-containing protein n=1 Tax=Aristolochia fimbriata TaxID=158543 RepID=A0AAV7F2R4_ARIFI|nr:hypothetical protein H6P81_007519 [Aristolochia fimbriata]
MASFVQPFVHYPSYCSSTPYWNPGLHRCQGVVTSASATTRENLRNSSTWYDSETPQLTISSVERPNQCLQLLKTEDEAPLFDEMLERTVDPERNLNDANDNFLGSSLVHVSGPVSSSPDTTHNFCVKTPWDRSFIIRALSLAASLQKLEHGRKIHAIAIKIGCGDDKFVATDVMGMYAKCKDTKSACEVFNQLTSVDIVSCNSLLSGYANNGLFDHALTWFVQIQSTGFRPSPYTLSIVLGVCGTLAAIAEGKQLHAYVIKVQCLHDSAVGNALLTMYCKCGVIKEAEILFDRLPSKNFISWTAIITGLYHSEFFDKALKQFNHMRQCEVNPTEHTYAVALACCGSINFSGIGRALHAMVTKSGFVSNAFVATSILNMYTKYDEMDDAEKLFIEMEDPQSTASWNALLSGYVYHGHNLKAMEVFNKMAQNPGALDQFTYTTILKACAVLPSLTGGNQIHAHTIKTEDKSSKHVWSSLIEMYAKSGEFTEANKVFDRMPRNLSDHVAWNSMLKAHSVSGLADKAILLFEKMIKEGMKPTSATFLAVLTACSHSGLVHQGQEIYESMVRHYGIAPEEKHYSCMVDLLGRSGRLEEARNFIRLMPIKPTTNIWRPLLAACQSHGNLPMAEYVAQRILEMDPNEVTAYITLSNMYAEVGRWRDAEKQRKFVELKGLKKEPGCSWIEVNHKVQKFFSRDTTHSETEKIYMKLEELVRQIKRIGYVPVSKVATSHRRDPEDEHVIYHSEKLAFSFGLIHVTAGRPIRIFKNLRICGDCHLFMKFMSKVTHRTIVIRDNYRFHFFKQGHCSCDDHW